MPSFTYSARNRTGLIEKGSVFAADRAAATASLNEKGRPDRPVTGNT
jgi:type II secretory pathway component PulF